MINRWLISTVLLMLFSLQLEAATIRLNFEVPYSTQVKRVQGNETVTTTVEIPYKPESNFFGPGDRPSKDDLKAATDKVNSDAKLTLWRKYLSRMPASNVAQSETAMQQRVDDLVLDLSIEQQVVTADKMIVFTLRGKINNNLVDQLAGYEPSEEDLEKARQMAKKKVLEKYITQLDSSKTAQVEKRKGNLRERTGDLVGEVSVRDYKVNNERKVVIYAIKGTVNDNLFNEVLFPSSTQSATGEGSLFAFLILPRIQSEVVQHDAERYERAEVSSGSTKENQSSEGMSETDGGMEEYESVGNKQRAVASAKRTGSTTRKTDVASWRLGNAQTVDSQINRYLTDSGFETVEFNDVVSECGADELSAEQVRDEVVASQSGTYPKRYAQMIKSALRECEVAYFGQGVMDVHSVRKDRNTGGMMAQVKVQVTVKNYEKRLPKKVASMSASVDGIGVSQDAAVDDAIEQASRKVVDIILAQIKKKGIR